MIVSLSNVYLERRKIMNCYECDDVYAIDDLIYVQSEGIHVCNFCLDISFPMCDNCGNYYRPERMSKSENGKLYCDNCIEGGKNERK